MAYSEGFLQIVGAFLILIIGIVIVRVIGSILKKIFKGMGINHYLKKEFNIDYNVEGATISVLRWVLYIFIILRAISELGVPTTTLRTIILILIGVVIVLAILAFRDTLPNILSGIHLRKSKKLKVEDTIGIKGIKGKIIGFGLMEVRIELKSHEIVFIPNSLFYKEYVYKK
jgi:small-conductance mechanosensitive channel